jgi:hypothetical protein
MQYTPRHILVVIALILTVASFVWPGPLLQVAVLLLCIALWLP